MEGVRLRLKIYQKHLIINQPKELKLVGQEYNRITKMIRKIRKKLNAVNEILIYYIQLLFFLVSNFFHILPFFSQGGKDGTWSAG